MAQHNEIGKKGEEIAREYLLKKGFRIRNFNWRFRKNEIDIIVEKDECLIVVEVKTQTNEYFENPKYRVDYKKQKFIIKATEAYINEFNIDKEIRFDIIAVTLLPSKIKIEHIEDAFQASLLI